MKQFPRALYAYAASIIGAGLAVIAAVVVSGFTTANLKSIHFVLLAIAVIVGEFIAIKVPHRDETLTVTLGDPFTLSLLFTFGLGPAILVKGLASLLEDANRRQPWWKTLFNVGQFALSLAVGSFVATGLGYSASDFVSLDLRDIAAALAGGAAYFVINTAIVTTAISISIGESPVDAFASDLRLRAIQYGALLGFAPIVTESLNASSALFPLLLVPMIIVYLNGRLTERQIGLRQQLAELYETTRISPARVGTRDSVRDLLKRVCTMFNASRASIRLFQEDSNESLRTTIDLVDGSFTYMEPTPQDAKETLWARAAAEDKGILLPHPITDPQLQSFYSNRDVKDLMIAPMHSEHVVTGVIEVFNRQGEQTFTSDELKLLETLANHASISLENARLINQLEDSLVHLTEMNRLKDDFVASVSHELRTPLTSIRGYVRTLLRPDVSFKPEDQKEFLETIDRQSTRLHRLIEDLLAVSRIESETDSSVASEVAIATLLDEVVAEIHTRIKAGQIQMEIEEDVPKVVTDAGKVHQIISNLIDNAIKYGGKDNPILVRARKEGDGVTISVTDRGPGVPPEMQERIFERFYQVDQSATRSVGGAGLGLYICRRIAEAIAGRVWLERTSSEGATFSLWIPPTVPDLDQTHLATVPAAPRAAWKL